ncbi:uncharacterized protein DNG_02522 [Cephalotrichum gorgonifer]|uniref:Uncharacterized protein n=1 Tax=Cephalotrichum gorgonifer TaxID=2041049 RepID=A0AAE8MUK9_9PEZI|nr:uncharacterized protein DNG_02522 [Cephalotrichum gorgonifer]
MHFKTVALVALAAVASAEKLEFTRINKVGLASLVRRADDGGAYGEGAYEPQESECGEGATCAEACGAGFEQCGESDGVKSCFNPTVGETCCASQGASCQAGFFCTHDDKETTVCCAEGTSLEDCAALNGAGGLTPDQPATTSAAPTTSAAESTSEPAYETTASAEASSSADDTTTSTSDDFTPEPTAPAENPGGADSGASVVAPAVALLAVGAFACLL